MFSQSQIAIKKAEINTNRMYERAALRTFERTGRDSALRTAQLHAEMAERKHAQLNEMLFQNKTEGAQS